MNKRLEKRHKRQVMRARGRLRLSTPDLRTPEQLKALREANRALVGHGSIPLAPYSATRAGNPADSAGVAVEKAEVTT
jgi:hypothetical protein